MVLLACPCPTPLLPAAQGRLPLLAPTRQHGQSKAWLGEGQQNVSSRDSLRLEGLMELDPTGRACGAWQASGAAGWERGRFGGPEAMAGVPPPLPPAWVSAGPQVSPGSPPHSIYPRLGGSPSPALRRWCLQRVCGCRSSSPSPPAVRRALPCSFCRSSVGFHSHGRNQRIWQVSCMVPGGGDRARCGAGAEQSPESGAQARSPRAGGYFLCQQP